MSRAVVLSSPPPPGLQESVKNSTVTWQNDLEALFKQAKERFPDVVWELTGEDDELQSSGKVEEVWGHKAIVYARAPPSFQSRYFSFRPRSDSPLPYSTSPTETYAHAESSVSLGLGLDIPPSMISRTPSPHRSVSPASSSIAPQQPTSSLLRISTSINPALFSNELEYLYTGQGFGEAFEFLFDSSEREEGGLDAEEMRIDKLRKDLVFMWRSRLYSDVRIALTGNFSSTTHESTTAIFSSHRFILVSRSPYFETTLLSWPGASKALTTNEPPTITLPSPPFTPASLHFTLGFIYTGTLFFSHRTYDLSTAFAILRASLYLGLSTLHDEIQARIAHEMLHGLFHAFLPFAEYEKLTQGTWGVGGCRCRQCARRVPRVLEFSLAEDVQNAHLERGSRRALVGLFGEGWCTQEFASLPQKLRESLLKGLAKRTKPVNVWALLWSAEHALVKLGPIIEPWGDTVREMIFAARKQIDEVICKESEACFATPDWLELLEADGARFEDGEKVEGAMAAVLRGVKEPWAATLYQTLVSSILLRPHPTEENAPMLSATSHVRVQVEQTRLELLKWIGRRWIAIRQEQGFDQLEGWALKEISDSMEVPLEDLLNPTPPPTKSVNFPNHQPHASPKSKNAAALLRPASHHPHTSRVDADSDAASSMRVSVLTRGTNKTNSNAPYTASLTPSARRLAAQGKDNASVVSSVRSSVRSTTTFESSASGSTVGATRRRPTASIGSNARVGGDGPDSPAKQIAAAARSRMSKERPDSKLTPDKNSALGLGRTSSPTRAPSIVESNYDNGRNAEDQDEEDADGTNEGRGEDDASLNGDNASVKGENETEDEEDTPEDARKTPTKAKAAAPVKRVLITRASLSSVTSRGTTSTTASPRPKSSASSLRSNATRKTSTTTPSTRSPTSSIHRPNSRGSTRTTGTTTTATSRANTRSVSSRSTLSTSSSRPSSRLSSSTTGTGRPSSSVSSSNTATTDSTFRTASSGLSTPVAPRSRRTSAASTASVRTATSTVSAAAPAPAVSAAAARVRKVSAGSVSSVASSVVGGARKTTVSTAKRERAPPVPLIDPKKLSPAVGRTPSGGSVGGGTKGKAAVKAPPLRTSASVSSLAGRKTPVAKKSPAGGKKEELRSVVSSSSSSSKDADVDEKEQEEDYMEKGENGGEDETVTEELDHESQDDETDGQSYVAPSQEPVSSSKPDPLDLPPPLPLLTEHRKSGSSASSSSVATIRHLSRDSVDTITTKAKSASGSSRGSHVSSGSASARQSGAAPEAPQQQPQQQQQRSAKPPSPPLPPLPYVPRPIPEDFVPQGATLDIGIPCIISSKRKRFKAYARYIGEVEGELGPWVGVEVPMPTGENTWGADRSVMSTVSSSMGGGGGMWGFDDRQWNDGSWGGVRYFEISSAGSEWGDDRASRRRRVDGGSVGGAVWGVGSGGKGGLKREGESLSVGVERMKRVRSASPAASDSSSMVESRGLFVRPQQVLYVVDAVGADF